MNSKNYEESGDGLDLDSITTSFLITCFVSLEKWATWKISNHLRPIIYLTTLKGVARRDMIFAGLTNL
jgi:hypothetical protein